MKVDQLQPYLKANWEGIKLQLEKGIYYPKPVRKVEIAKPGGAGKRMLGIPMINVINMYFFIAMILCNDASKTIFP